MTRHRARGTAATFLPVLVALAALVLAGCGGGGRGAHASPSSTGSSSGPATSAPVSPTATYTVGKAYLPVPDGVTLTVPGTPVTLGSPITAAWQPSAAQVGVVTVTVKKVETTSVAVSLSQYRLTHAQRYSTPYFVHADVENVGATDLGGLVLPLYLRTNVGTLVESTGVAQDFPGCSHRVLPAPFPAGATTHTCLIFLAPKGSYYGQIAFVPPVGIPLLRWYGPTQPIPGRTGFGAPAPAKKSTKHAGQHGKKKHAKDRHLPRPQDGAPSGTSSSSPGGVS